MVTTQEQRLRRAAKRQGLELHKSRARDPLAVDYDRWEIRAADLGGALVAGELGTPQALTIEEVEVVITSGDLSRQRPIGSAWATPTEWERDHPGVSK